MLQFEDSQSLPWVEKYRPKSFEEVLSHDDIVHTLSKLAGNRQLPHLLLHGPPGTGKTSTVKIIVKTLFGSDYQRSFLELNASDDRGINTVRNVIKTFAETTSQVSIKTSEENSENLPSQGTIPELKVIMLDEADQMTGPAQMALRRIIENYAHFVRFVIVCNYVNKISPALQSRCTKLRFPPLKPTHIRLHTDNVCKAEGVELTSEAAETLISIAKGDMRKVLNYLQSAHLSNKNKVITSELLCDTVGIPTQETADLIFDYLTTLSFQSAFQRIKSILDLNGYCLTDVITALHAKLICLNLPTKAFCIAFPRMAEIENALAYGADPQMQFGALVAIFTELREFITAPIAP